MISVKLIISGDPIIFKCCTVFSGNAGTAFTYNRKCLVVATYVAFGLIAE